MNEINLFHDYWNHENLTCSQEQECFSNIEDINNRETIIKSHLKLVLSICNKYKFFQDSLYTDLVQNGVLGLIESIDCFNPSLGYRFSTFAQHRIKGEIQAFLRRMSFSYYVPDNKSWELSKILKNITECELLSLSAIYKVMQLLNCSEKHAQSLLILLSDSKLDKPAGPTSQTTDIEDQEIIDLIDVRKSFLSENEQILLKLRYEDGCSWRQIGDKLGMSHEGVRKKHNRIIFKLRDFIENKIKWILKDCSSKVLASVGENIY